MDIIKKIFTVVILSAMAFYAKAAERPVYPCHRLAQAPVVDGKIDDAVWQNAPEATGFYSLRCLGRYAVEKQTYFKAGWTDDAIYLAIRAEESAPEKMVAKANDGGALWEDDSMELFFIPSGAPTYMQLIVNSLGWRYNGSWNEGGTEHKDLLDWEARAVVGKTEWFLELRVPFAVLMGKIPREGEEWPANVARNILTGPLDERHTSWPLLKGGFGDMNNFGRFAFMGPAGDKVMAEENEINQAYLQYARGAIEKLARGAEGYVKELAEMKKLNDGNVEAENLLSVWERVVKIAAQANVRVNYREVTPVCRACVGLPQRSDTCIARGMMEVLFKESAAKVGPEPTPAFGHPSGGGELKKLKDNNL